MLSLLIPSWNNLPCLKRLVESIEATARVDHEILIYVNDGQDGTLEWVKSRGYRHLHSATNQGVCLSVNSLAAIATREWLCYLNDDMVCCPDWDTAFATAIGNLSHDLAFLSGTLIEPRPSIDPGIITHDLGRDPAIFDTHRLAVYSQALTVPDRDGVGGQPTLIARRWWHAVGGYSVEFGPGMSSDDDLLMKLWVTGARVFRQVGASRFYHFAMASTGRVRKNKGGRSFVMKWGLTQPEFHRHLAARAERFGTSGNPAEGFPRPTWRGRLRRAAYGLFGHYPLGDLEAWSPAPARSDGGRR